MYKVYLGDSCELYQKHSALLHQKAQLVYLDPPYNSGRRRGARKFYGDSSRQWAGFMRNILADSREMLSATGFLAVSINQTELFHIKSLADEVMGEACFVGLFPVKIRHKDRQLMINATFHDVYEYLLIYRKNKTQRFYCRHKPADLSKFCYAVDIVDDTPANTVIGGKQVLIYDEHQYSIRKTQGSEAHFRRYIIAGKLKTANWSGEWFENHLRGLGKNKLVKVFGLEKEGLGYRWFLTQSDSRISGIYFQSAANAGRPLLPANDIDLTDEVTNIYREGGPGCDFKDSKKPEKLLDWLIGITTQSGDLVVDMFGGSGTALACCLKSGRQCVTVEKHAEPYKIIQTRVANMRAQQAQGQEAGEEVSFEEIKG